MIKFVVSVFMLLLFNLANAQICGTPGLDGPENISGSINSYFPPSGNVTLNAGSKTLLLSAVPLIDDYGNNFGSTSIQAGDLLLIIQMQDAIINFDNNASYGSGNPTSGPDGLGGTGYTSLGNTGRFEYLIATSSVLLTGGQLTFRGAGTGNGTVHSYINKAATATEGKKTFQIVRVPQFSNLVLQSNITTPPFNGVAGGIIAFDVSGTMNFNGFTIDASARGFRGGYGPVGDSFSNIANIYAIPSSNPASTGKGEGIAGTPRYMWDGYNQVDNLVEGLPGGSYGKGAPANGGGGGNDHNSGGGGGGNGGEGGVGGIGYEPYFPIPGTFPNGGRPGSITYLTNQPDISRLIMGGGGGGGDANDAIDGVKGGVGGGVILINVSTITGTGRVLANGSNGAAGVAGERPDGAGGGGAGGTVFIKVSNPDPSANLQVEAKGGDGGSTERDPGTEEHGPGGGGGGGQVFFAVATSTVTVDVDPGRAGITESGQGTPHGAAGGQDGKNLPFLSTDLPPYLQGGGFICYPELTTRMFSEIPLVPKLQGSEIKYTIETTNATGRGNAGGVQIQAMLPSGIIYKSASVTYIGTTAGPTDLSNISLNPDIVTFGDFNIPPGDVVKIIITASVECSTPANIYDASVQAAYLDPSRTIADPQRRITSFINAFPDSKTSYETGNQGNVLGTNYNGTLPLSNAEDITIEATLPITKNTVSLPTSAVPYCDSANPPLITGAVAERGNGIAYQWQISEDGINFADIVNATAKDFNPETIIKTTYYRRKAISVCVPEVFSNIIPVNVYYSPKADFDVPEICLDDATATFTNKSTNFDNTESGLTYLWDFGDHNANPQRPNISSDKNPSHVYTQAGNYTITLTITTDDGCTDTKDTLFTVNGSTPKANFVVQNLNSLCSYSAVGFKDSASVDFGEITKIEWYFDFENKPNENLIDENPVLRSAQDSIYTHDYGAFHSPVSKQFLVKMVAYSGGICFNEKIIPITVYAVPTVEFDSIPPVCSASAPFILSQGKEIHQVLTGEETYSGAGVNEQGLFDPAAAGVGTHEITYRFVADNGCADSAKQHITVYQSPTVESDDVKILEGGQIQLTATTTGDRLIYKWEPAQFLDRDDVLNPIASPTDNIRYSLIVTNNNGCSDTSFVNVTVLKLPEVPNTITPNGDGINDVWNIEHLNTYQNAIIQIFNRYGKIIYTSINYFKPWDGKHMGNDLPDGTYYYIIDPKNGRKKITGSITIIR